MQDVAQVEEDWEDASLRRLIDELPDLVCRFTPDANLLYVNRAYAAYHDRRPEDMVGCRFTEFVDPEVRPAIEAALWGMRAMGPHDPVRRNTHQSRTASGELRWHEWTDRAFFNGDGTLLGFMSIGRDMTELLARQDAVEHDLLYDDLTGVLNRRGLMAAVGDRLVHAAEPVLVGYIDIDDFKRVNDRNGHQVGDAALAAVAGVLESIVPDGTVGRIGGDEFIVISPGRGADAPSNGPGLGAVLDERLAELTPRITVSCGWVIAQPGDTAETVLHRADEAMYASKRQRQLSA